MNFSDLGDLVFQALSIEPQQNTSKEAVGPDFEEILSTFSSSEKVPNPVATEISPPALNPKADTNKAGDDGIVDETVIPKPDDHSQDTPEFSVQSWSVLPSQPKILRNPLIGSSDEAITQAEVFSEQAPHLTEHEETSLTSLPSLAPDEQAKHNGLSVSGHAQVKDRIISQEPQVLPESNFIDDHTKDVKLKDVQLDVPSPRPLKTSQDAVVSTNDVWPDEIQNAGHNKAAYSPVADLENVSAPNERASHTTFADANTNIRPDLKDTPVFLSSKTNNAVAVPKQLQKVPLEQSPISPSSELSASRTDFEQSEIIPDTSESTKNTDSMKSGLVGTELSKTLPINRRHEDQIAKGPIPAPQETHIEPNEIKVGDAKKISTEPSVGGAIEKPTLPQGNSFVPQVPSSLGLNVQAFAPTDILPKDLEQPPQTPIPQNTVPFSPIEMSAVSGTSVNPEAFTVLDPEVDIETVAITQATLGVDMPRADGAVVESTSGARADHGPRAVQQIVVALAMSNDGQIELRLDPEELGPVRLSLVSVEGSITVHLQAERSDTLDLLRRHADLLARELRDIGYGDVEFRFGSGTSSDGQPTPHSYSEPEAADDLTQVSSMQTETVTPPARLTQSGLDLRL